MKKLISIALVGALALAAGCSGKNEEKKTEGASDHKLALVLSTQNNPFFVSLKDGAEAEAKKLGFDLVVLDSQNDPARELSNVEDLTVKGVEAIMINPTDSDAVANAVRVANRADIPVITLDRAANGGKVVAHVASDNVAGGEMAGKYIAERLNGTGQVIQLEGVPGTSAARERGKGFMEAIKGTGLELVASQPADFDRTKALNVTENLLEAHPDVKAIFAQNDEMALGAARAASARGKKLVIVGFDGTASGIKGVGSGELSATIAQQAAQIGSIGVDTAVKVVKGEEVPKNIPVPLKLITE